MLLIGENDLQFLSWSVPYYCCGLSPIIAIVCHNFQETSVPYVSPIILKAGKLTETPDNVRFRFAQADLHGYSCHVKKLP